MTSEELVVVLYDELVKRLKKASIALEIGKLDIFDESITRCSDIVLYLKEALNFEYQISYELVNFYNFFLYELTRAKSSRNPEIMAGIEPLIKDLREAFGEAAKTL